MDSEAHVEKDPVPQAIRDAERWRLAGERLRKRSPETFQRLFMLLATQALLESDDDRDLITESYFLT